MDAARECIVGVAERRQLTPRDFAATLVLVVSDGRETVTVHVGDGCAVARDASQNHWTALSWPDQGDYAAMTYFVTDESTGHIRTLRHTGEISALALFSDGLERLALDFRAREAYGPFFSGMVAPVQASPATRKDRALSQRLHAYLASEEVNRRTEDDKTLILAVLR